MESPLLQMQKESEEEQHGNSTACSDYTGWKRPMGEEQRNAKKLWSCQGSEKSGDDLPGRLEHRN